MSGRVHLAEWVSAGHPDRLADAIAERCVEHALAHDPDALVGIEVAVHRKTVFVDGRIAAGANGPGAPEDFLPELCRGAYRAAGFGGRWSPAPEDLVVLHDLCVGPLVPDERSIRPFSDDQNVVVGYACGDERTEYLPAAHWLARKLGERVSAWRTREAADRFGPDFKLLPVLEEHRLPGGGTRWNWRRLVLSIQHAPGLSYREQYGALGPLVEKTLSEFEAVLPGAGTSFTSAALHLNGAGDFSCGGPEGDNGLSGKKLVVDHYGPSVPIGGGAIFGKDPHKVDRRGAKRAREKAIELVKGGAREARVTLAWAPGETEPFVAEAETRDAAGVWRIV
ncbi:MAG: methionine adenosyltransferase [Planctomycetes bacterium]|nr:methionine adenosyltransferase [Planctomycetota bacterium]